MAERANRWRWLSWAMVVLPLSAARVKADAGVPKAARDLSVEEQALLEEYRANYERLRRFYDNIRLEVVRRTSLIPAHQTKENPEGIRDTRLVYRANGGKFYRMDVVSLDFRDASPTGRTLIKLVRPEGYAVAIRERPDKPFAIAEWTENRDAGLNSLSAYVFQWSPYSMHVFPMKWFIFGEPDWAKDYRLQKVVAEEVAGERLVTIKASAVTKRGESHWRGSFVFYRDRAWALREVSSVVFAGDRPFLKRDDYADKGLYQYEGMHEGVPLLKRVEYWHEEGPTQTRWGVETHEVVSVEVGPVPEEDFSPAVLGAEVAGQRSRWVPLMLGVLSIVLLLVLYFLLRRKEAKGPKRAA